jgi:heat shock protein HslJ
MNSNRFLLFSICAIILAGCVVSQAKHDSPSASRERITASDANRIASTTWRLEKLVFGRETFFPVENSEIAIVFGNDGKVNGMATINRFFGGFGFEDNDKITWSPHFGSTKMAGPQNLMEQESRFLNALPLTDSVFLESEILWLESSEGSVVLKFREKD